MKIKLNTPLNTSDIAKLKIGDEVYLNGIIYTARDAAHKKLDDLIKAKKPLPLPLKGNVIYYVGPTPKRPSRVIGSAGPTSSYRMDKFTPKLLSLGLRATIGKGERTDDVVKAMKKYKAIYLAAIGGAGALISKCIKKCEVIAYPELGPEAIYKLKVENLPVIVINDIKGNDLYRKAKAKK